MSWAAPPPVGRGSAKDRIRSRAPGARATLGRGFSEQRHPRMAAGGVRRHTPARPRSLLPMTVVDETLEPVEPELSDGAFVVTWHDVSFLGLTPESVSSWRSRACPLGLDVDGMGAFVDGLVAAIAADGLDGDVDVRLQGSAASFFSSSLKPMPLPDAASWAPMYVASWLDDPSPETLEAVSIRWTEWLKGRAGPHRRPFDSLFQLGIVRDKSDIDVQVSSGVADARSPIACSVLGYDDGWNQRYGFLRDEVSALVAPHLISWSESETDRLDRVVAVKIFGAGGPPDVSDDSPVSSHFQDSDWRLL